MELANQKGLNVISLFNGMGTLRQALVNQGFLINKCYSSEIKPYAIELVQHHFPDTIQVGDINNWREWDIDWKSIDFIGSGSPCQDLSAANKERLGLRGKKSSLFFVFIEILEHVKSLNPNVIFFQENVGSANIPDIGIMSRALGVYPVRFNSSLVTAQLRDRYYWTNIRTKKTMFDIVVDIPKPKDKGIMLKDILTSGFIDRDKSLCLLEGYYSKKPKQDYDKFMNRYKMGMLQIVFEKETRKLKIKTNTIKGFDIMTENDCLNLSFPSSKTRRGRVTKGKSTCLLQGNEPLFVMENYNLRLLNKIEMCRLQGFPDDYCDTISTNKAASLLGDGWTLPIVEHIFSFMSKV